MNLRTIQITLLILTFLKNRFQNTLYQKLLPVSFLGKFDDGQYTTDWVNRMSLERMNEQVPDEYKIMLTYVEYYE